MNDRLLTRAFLLCFAANFLQGTAFNLFLYLPRFLEGLGAQEAQIGFLAGLTGAAAIAVRPPVGRAMDLRGRRLVILVGGCVNVIALTLYLTVTSIGPWIYVVRVLHGLGEAMLFPAFFTYAADCVPASRRTQGLALFGVSGMLPISLAALLAERVLAQADFEAIFQLALALAVASLLLSLPLRDVARAPHEDEPSRGFFAALGQRDLLPLWFVGTAFATSLTAPFVFVTLYVVDHQLGDASLFFVAYTAIALVLRVGFGWLPDRVGPKRVLFPALASLAVGCVLIGQAESPAALAAAGVLCGIGHGYTFPVLFAMVVSRARDSERGAVMSVFTGLFDAGVLIGGPLFGLLVETAGYGSMYAAAGALVVAGMVGFALLDRGR